MSFRYFLLLITCWVYLLKIEACAQIKLHTDDLPHFYQAFDSVMTTSDSAQQARFIQKLYVDKASAGLKEFMEIRGVTP